MFQLVRSLSHAFSGSFLRGLKSSRILPLLKFYEKLEQRFRTQQTSLQETFILSAQLRNVVLNNYYFIFMQGLYYTHKEGISLAMLLSIKYLEIWRYFSSI